MRIIKTAKHIPVIFTCLLLTSCSPKQAQTENSATNDTLDTEEVVEEIEIPETNSDENTHNTPLYPKKIQGLWGNYAFLEKLKETNIVSEAHSAIDDYPEPDIKIAENDAVVDNFYYMEAYPFDPKKYLIQEGDSSSTMYVKNLETGKRKLYVKMRDLPDEYLYSLYDKEYSALHMMTWEWFQGEYDCTNLVDNTSKTLTFTKDGFVKGLGESSTKYSLSVAYFGGGPDDDIPGPQDVMYVDKGMGKGEFLIEYRDNTFYLYAVKEWDSAEDPYIKDYLAYKLTKKN